MNFDKNFYIQRNRDSSNSIIPLDDFDNCRMRGIEKYPVQVIGEIDAVEVDHDVSSEPLDEITLKLIVTQLHPYALMMKDVSYYMQLLFYDFNKVIHLFLFNAKVAEINDIPTNDRRKRYSLVITSIKNAEQAAYKVFETKHKGMVSQSKKVYGEMGVE